MKKLFALIFVILLFAFSFTCFSAALSEKVEIAFKVGDSTLVINGEEKTVETPYVVGEGVTLVPVRVITEAFGAEVGWEAADKKVILAYEDTEINLWIGKANAVVNGSEKELLSAPELSNNVTMVPLRFISENFGAEVGYDADTKGITITKEAEKPKVETKDGTYYFYTDNMEFTAHVPYDFILETEQNGFYDFVMGFKYNYSVNTVLYSVNAVDDIKDAAKNDREQQISDVSSERINVTGITDGKMNGMDVYVYQVVDEKKNALVTKTFFDHGAMSYLLLEYVTDVEYAAEKNENGEFSLKGLSVTVPTAFRGREMYARSTRPASNDVESIGVGVMKKTNGADPEEYLRYNALIYSSQENKREFVENKIYKSTYTVMGEDVSAYEYTMTGSGIKTRGIVFELSDHVVYVDFMTNLDEQETKYFVENLVFDFEKLDAPSFENALTYENMIENTKKVKTGDVSFEVPESFEVTYSKDKLLVIAEDPESDLVLFCIGKACSIDNDDEVAAMKPVPYYGMVEGTEPKRTVSETMSETRTFVDTYLEWDTAASTRRAFSGKDLPKNGTDSAKFVKLKLGSTWYYLNLYQIRADGFVNKNKQIVTPFVFEYTSEYSNYSTMMKMKCVMQSVEK